MTTSHTLWFQRPGEAAHASSLAHSACFDAHGRRVQHAVGSPRVPDSAGSPGSRDAVRRHDLVHLFPVHHPEGFAAAVLVPADFPTLLRLDGRPLAAGMHPLRHACALSVPDWTLWVSTQGAPEALEYQPALHGQELHCFRTKARLQAGEAVVRCPGTPEESCGRLFRAVAWSAQLPCHGCGFDPARPLWTPPTPRARLTPDELLERFRGVHA